MAMRESVAMDCIPGASDGASWARRARLLGPGSSVDTRGPACRPFTRVGSMSFLSGCPRPVGTLAQHLAPGNEPPDKTHPGDWVWALSLIVIPPRRVPGK